MGEGYWYVKAFRLSEKNIHIHIIYWWGLCQGYQCYGIWPSVYGKYVHHTMVLFCFILVLRIRIGLGKQSQDFWKYGDRRDEIKAGVV